MGLDFLDMEEVELKKWLDALDEHFKHRKTIYDRQSKEAAARSRARRR